MEVAYGSVQNSPEYKTHNISTWASFSPGKQHRSLRSFFHLLVWQVTFKKNCLHCGGPWHSCHWTYRSEVCHRLENWGGATEICLWWSKSGNVLQGVLSPLSGCPAVLSAWCPLAQRQHSLRPPLHMFTCKLGFQLGRSLISRFPEHQNAIHSHQH